MTATTTPDMLARIRAVADSQETPFLVVDRQTIRDRYDELTTGFPDAGIYYAVKANPAPEVLELLRDKGACFDIASIYELDRVLNLGVSAERTSFGNTIKKAKDVRYAHERGVRLFATDSEGDLRNIARAAPGARIYVRVLTDTGQSADWPLTRKFGCQPDMAYDLLVLARELGLVPAGLSFHVGSQQRDIGAWDAAIAKVSAMFVRLREEEDIRLTLLNIGGGFPATYVTPTNPVATYASEIHRFLEGEFGDEVPRIILEPGRSLVSDAGVLVSEIVLISRKSRTSLNRWIYLDVGKFSGLIETLDEAIKYPILTDKNGEVEESILAGPTCDSTDTLYEHYKYALPLNLAIGDRVYFLSTGAYTTSYSSVEFNGFPPLRSYYV